jgi:hypothetical protein
VVLRNALDPAIHEALIREWPALDDIHSRCSEGPRHSMGTTALVAHPRIGDTWKAVANAGREQAFLERLLRVLAHAVAAEYPRFAETHAPLEGLMARPHGPSVDRRRAAVAMEVQLAADVRMAGTRRDPRRVHVHDPRKLFVGVLCLSADRDDGIGGDLDFYQPVAERPVYGPHRVIDREALRRVHTIPYRANTLVLMLNTARSLHGAVARGDGAEPRYVLNFSGRVEPPLFSVQQTLSTVTVRRLRRWRRRLTQRVRRALPGPGTADD